jgi:hypothetical protein
MAVEEAQKLVDEAEKREIKRIAQKLAILSDDALEEILASIAEELSKRARMKEMLRRGY